MIQAIFMMGGLGVIVGVGLAVASKVFYVYVDPKVEAVDDALPGANCGGCGLPGCSSNAEAIVAGKAAPDSCVAAGDDVTEAIAAIMGVSIEAKEPDIARPGCTYGTADADTRYVYDGVDDCRAVALLSGGMKVCRIGCLGLGTCAKACPFDAIVMGPDGLPKVIEEKCTGCGTCERVCPKHIITLSSVTRRILKEYTDEDCTTPCQRACPAGIDIREYIHQIVLGDYRAAVQVIKERNPFPTVIGRICPRPCESECRRKLVDEPVAINYLKRFTSDFEWAGKERILPYTAPKTGRAVAVVGGGVEGLSTAFFTARLGHAPTVYDASPKLGGLLRSAISRYRLSHDILDWDIEGILEMGVTARTEVVMGRDFTIASLFDKKYDAVFVATGGWDSRLAREEGIEEVIPGTYLVIDLIKSDTKRTNPIPCHENVVISGSGKTALDAALICNDLGAESITVLLSDSKEQLFMTEEALQEVLDEGIQIIYRAGIHRLHGQGAALTKVDYIAKDTGETFSLPAQSLFLGSGRYPELVFVPVKPDESDDMHNQETKTDEERPEASVQWTAQAPCKPASPEPEIGLFAKGDIVTDYSAAIKAIAGGRRAAAALHQMMYGIQPELPANAIHDKTPVQNVDHVENVATVPRKIMPLCSGSDLNKTGTLEKGFDEETALGEAKRCLQCGLICYEWQIRPEDRNLTA